MTSKPATVTVTERRWATILEAAAYAGLSRTTINREFSAGRLTRHKFGGRVLIDLNELDAAIAATGYRAP